LYATKAMRDAIAGDSLVAPGKNMARLPLDILRSAGIKILRKFTYATVTARPDDDAFPARMFQFGLDSSQQFQNLPEF